MYPWVFLEFECLCAVCIGLSRQYILEWADLHYFQHPMSQWIYLEWDVLCSSALLPSGNLPQRRAMPVFPPVVSSQLLMEWKSVPGSGLSYYLLRSSAVQWKCLHQCQLHLRKNMVIPLQPVYLQQFFLLERVGMHFLSQRSGFQIGQLHLLNWLLLS